MITVIIPTRNRAELLRNTIESITAQIYPSSKFEVIIVNNASTDHTVGVVDSFLTRFSHIRCVYEPELGLHAGRHRGLKEAKGDVLVYVDDDIIATPSWLSAIAENFIDSKVVMVGGNNFPDFQGEVPAWLQKLWLRPSMGGQGNGWLSILSLPEGRREFSPNYVWGCNFSIRKKVLLDAGGFHPDGMPAELIRFRGDGESHVSGYVMKHKLKCVFDSRASVFHAVTPERMSFDYFRQRSFNQGISDSYTRLRNQPKFGMPTSYSINIVRRLFGSIYHVIKQDQEKDSEISILFAIIRKSYQEGFNYHQQMYREDPEVRNWVHKLTYY